MNDQRKRQQFVLAKRDNVIVKLLIDGPSGHGKTYTSLLIADMLAQGGRVGVIDTQNRQSERYADLFKFGVYHISSPYHPDKFIEAIDVAAAARLDVVILDTATHEWSGPGGILELVKRPNGLDNWKDGSPLHQRFLEAIIQAPMHMIVTCRTKNMWDYPKNDRGFVTPVRVGTDAIQRQEFEFEFDAWLRMQPGHMASVEKSVFGEHLPIGSIIQPGHETGLAILRWIAGEPSEAVNDEAEEDVPSGFVNDDPEDVDDDEGEDSDFTPGAEEDEPDFAEHDAGLSLPQPVAALQSPQTARTAPQRSTEPQRTPSTDSVPVGRSTDELVGTSEPCVETDCTTKVYPKVLEKLGTSEVKGETLIRLSRQNLGGKVYCVEHYLRRMENRKRTTAARK